MKTLSQIVFALTITLALTLSGKSAVLLDDNWDDGDRTDTNLPDEAAWFASVFAATPTLSAVVGALNGNILMFETNSSSRLWITHFTPAGAPAELAIGDTLKITAAFTLTGASLASTTRGLRIGLFNFSEPGASRVSADGFSTGAGGGAPGANVTGYGLNVNIAPTLINNPLQLLKRTDTASINLMGASAVYSTLSSGGGAAGTPGFRSSVPYVLELSVKRNESSVDVTAKFSDNDAWSISHTATDSTSPNFRFDGFAMRPSLVADVAETFTFTQFKAEVVPSVAVLRITSFRLLPFEAHITWDARPGKTYQIDARAAFDLINDWVPVGLVTATTTSASYIEADYTEESQRYYRIVELP